jgi:hypothetical protein
MLCFIDFREVFDRTMGLRPFLLLDSHGSRFDLEFLEYINAEEMKWNVDIGLPYGTSYWQVGDSSEQNGSFKMKLTKVKKNLTSKKNDARLAFEVGQRDVGKLVRESWNESFAKVVTNRKAVLTRGWGPKALNYNVLLHKEIIGTNKSETSSQQLTATIDPRDLNLTEGSAGTWVHRICLRYNEKSRQHDGTA